MDITKVRFRFNKQTGEIEEFVVDIPEPHLPEAEHNRRHDQLAAEVGRVVEQHPLVVEVPGSGTAAVPEQEERSTAVPETSGEGPAAEPGRKQT